MRFIVDRTKTKHGKCHGCGRRIEAAAAERLYYLGAKHGWACESCIEMFLGIFENEMRSKLPEIRAALIRLTSHAPKGIDLLDAELVFNPERDRFELQHGQDRYWFGEDCLICLQAGIVTYYKNGEGYSASPPHRN
jgi:hypothetical protein